MRLKCYFMTKNSFVVEVTFKQICNFKMQVCLGAYALLLPPDINSG